MPRRRPAGTQGVPLSEMRRVRDYWLNDYDWRRCETRLNGVGQYRTEIEGLGIHFLHIRSPEADARALVMTHGWPGSVIEFLDVIGPLTDPVAHGGDAADAFHLVLPSLPGYGFSDRPAAAGWTVERIAAAWLELMTRLGYDRFIARAGTGVQAWPRRSVRWRPTASRACISISLLPVSGPDDMDGLTPDERAMLEALQRHQATGRGYSEQQRTRPQTLGYGLADSPIGQAAWIWRSTANGPTPGTIPRAVFGMDALLDNVMLYWLSNSGASAARMYWQNRDHDTQTRVAVPVAISLFPKEMFRTTRRRPRSATSWRAARPVRRPAPGRRAAGARTSSG